MTTKTRRSEKDTSTETKKRWHSTNQDEVEEENMEPSGERSVKPKVTMEYLNPENSSRRSSDSGTRASLSSNGHPDQLHALSAADLPHEWNYWQDTFPQRVRIGEPHSGCSDVSSEPRKIALILNTTFRPRTAWQLRDHPCLLNPRSTSDRDCHHAPLSKDTDVAKRLSFSTSSRVTSIVVCSQNHPTNHSSSLTAAT